MVKTSDKINDAHGNHIKEHELKDKPVYIKVSDETRSIIDKYKEKGTTISDLVKNAVNCYDEFNSISPEMHGIIEKYKEEGEADIKFIERALKYYGNQKDRRISLGSAQNRIHARSGNCICNRIDAQGF